MDDFVNKIFKNKVFVEAKMQKFGFKRPEILFVYTEKLLNNQFEFYIKDFRHKKHRNASDRYTNKRHLYSSSCGRCGGYICRRGQRGLSEYS